LPLWVVVVAAAVCQGLCAGPPFASPLQGRCEQVPADDGDAAGGFNLANSSAPVMLSVGLAKSQQAGFSSMKTCWSNTRPASASNRPTGPMRSLKPFMR
jgi:hypothetical protein